MAVTASSGVASTSPATTAYLDSESPNTTSEAHGLERSSRSAVAAWSCLLLSEEASRRERLRHSAEAAGWDAIACGSIELAAQEADRWRTLLAIIDLGAMPASQKAAYLQFANRLASRERLLLICDEPTHPESELQARQAGAWLYVPAPDLGDGVTELLCEARGVAEKLNDPGSVTV